MRSDISGVRQDFTGFVRGFGTFRYSAIRRLSVSIGNTYKGQLNGSSPICSAIIFKGNRLSRKIKKSIVKSSKPSGLAPKNSII